MFKATEPKQSYVPIMNPDTNVSYNHRSPPPPPKKTLTTEKVSHMTIIWEKTCEHPPAYSHTLNSIILKHKA